MACYRGEREPVHNLERCRRMRRKPTPAERLLWFVLRGRRLSGFKFRRQHAFGPYVLDFYCADANLAVEADGAQHEDPENAAWDAARTAYLARKGACVLRFTNERILAETERVVAEIEEVARRRCRTEP